MVVGNDCDVGLLSVDGLLTLLSGVLELGCGFVAGLLESGDAFVPVG